MLPDYHFISGFVLVYIYTKYIYTYSIYILSRKHFIMRKYRKKANTILEFSELVLNSNQFKFLGQHYLQTSGTAMGTKMAPSCADLFMGVLEKQMLSSYKHKPLVYFRYIYEIFMIWTDGEDSLNEFLTHYNSQN